MSILLYNDTESANATNKPSIESTKVDHISSNPTTSNENFFSLSGIFQRSLFLYTKKNNLNSRYVCL